jgi:hypothetical protein
LRAIPCAKSRRCSFSQAFRPSTVKLMMVRNTISLIVSVISNIVFGSLWIRVVLAQQLAVARCITYVSMCSAALALQVARPCVIVSASSPSSYRAVLIIQCAWCAARLSPALVTAKPRAHQSCIRVTERLCPQSALDRFCHMITKGIFMVFSNLNTRCSRMRHAM